MGIGVGTKDYLKEVVVSELKGRVQVGEIFVNVTVGGYNEDFRKVGALVPQDRRHVSIANRGDGPDMDVVGVQDSGTAVGGCMVGLVTAAINNTIIMKVGFLNEEERGRAISGCKD